ncbi:hypothetical protein BJX66DRAFT_301721 [Aspergillus keveii]|uniref:Uncharacterized protein n=1 Tax=Aspergillus keveii TaxID=714993 RepID=A0ABR4G8X8_9EURO
MKRTDMTKARNVGEPLVRDKSSPGSQCLIFDDRDFIPPILRRETAQPDSDFHRSANSLGSNPVPTASEGAKDCNDRVPPAGSVLCDPAPEIYSGSTILLLTPHRCEEQDQPAEPSNFLDLPDKLYQRIIEEGSGALIVGEEDVFRYSIDSTANPEGLLSIRRRPRANVPQDRPVGPRTIGTETQPRTRDNFRESGVLGCGSNP